jgi:hypothetical protein
VRVLIACEYSGTVRDAFIAAGHDAMSCDLLPSDRPGPHYQGDIVDILRDDWGLMIAEGRAFITMAPWISGIPGLALAILLVALNLLADGLRDALDPRRGEVH